VKARLFFCVTGFLASVHSSKAQSDPMAFHLPHRTSAAQSGEENLPAFRSIQGKMSGYIQMVEEAGRLSLSAPASNQHKLIKPTLVAEIPEKEQLMATASVPLIDQPLRLDDFDGMQPGRSYVTTSGT
jgi:hypothetical protein